MKVDISTIRRALNECSPNVGSHIEDAYNTDDAFKLWQMIKVAVNDEVEATSEETV